MLNKVNISIVMPLFNKEREVARAISSVLAQTFSSFELVVVDDGSTDHSTEIVATFNDPRIRLIKQANAGVSAARNRGVDEARADLVAFIDADDEWLSDFLSTINLLLQSYPLCSVFATSYLISRSGIMERKAILNGVGDDFNDGILRDYFVVAAQSDPPIWSSAVAIKKKALSEIGGFPLGVASGEDLVTWARLAARYDIAYSRIPLARFYAPFSISQRTSRKPTLPDQVSIALNNLINTSPPERIRGLSNFIAVWHKMRAVYWLQLNQGYEARNEIALATQGGESKKHLQALKVLSHLPWKLPAISFLAISSGLFLWRVCSNNFRKLLLDSLRAIHSLKLRIRLKLCDYDLVFRLLYATRPKYKSILICKDTDIIIEGFPRSGNTYAYACFLLTNGDKHKVARHIHLGSQINMAIKYSTPALIIFRNPVESISSYLVRNKYYSEKSAINYYIKYYENIIKNKDNIVLCEFRQLITNFESAIKRLNEKYNTSFAEVNEVDIDKEKVYSLIDSLEKIDSRGLFFRSSHIARPDNKRAIRKNIYIGKLNSVVYQKDMKICSEIYNQMLELSKQ